MDQQIIENAISHAATNVFGTMLGLDVEVGQSFLEKGPTPESERVVALIGLAGTWIGTGVIGCSPHFACRIASLMLMTEYHAVNEDVLDALAEMSNMIFGSVKTALEGHLGLLGLSIPTVIFGRGFTTRTVGQQAWRVFPLRAGNDEIELKFRLMPNGNTQKSESRIKPSAVASGFSSSL